MPRTPFDFPEHPPPDRPKSNCPTSARHASTVASTAAQLIHLANGRRSICKANSLPLRPYTTHVGVGSSAGDREGLGSLGTQSARIANVGARGRPNCESAQMRTQRRKKISWAHIRTKLAHATERCRRRRPTPSRRPGNRRTTDPRKAAGTTSRKGRASPSRVELESSPYNKLAASSANSDRTPLRKLMWAASPQLRNRLTALDNPLDVLST